MSDWAKRVLEKASILKKAGVYRDETFEKILEAEMSNAQAIHPGVFSGAIRPAAEVAAAPVTDYASRTPSTIDPASLVLRLLGFEANKQFIVHAHQEGWGQYHRDILHIAILDAHNKTIVRFEEDPATFPSHQLIDKLRLLGNG